MTQEKLDRINELARLKKQRALSDAEKAEQKALREEYLAEWRKGAEQALSNTYIEECDGSLTRLKKKE
ncbi:DUF896 domain-containing protein [Clostridiaceae bacterium OttesenSCG-928-D20]|nr:DUF896 domain-containing protein [Clostridiaceae bacterium OttesenSCG-928-D20]